MLVFRIKALLRTRTFHARIILRDWQNELEEPNPWADHGVSRVASECMMLDVHKMALGSREHTLASEATHPLRMIIDEEEVSSPETPHAGHLELEPSKFRISLQDMITTSVALKSNLNIDIDAPTSATWPAILFPSGNNVFSKASDGSSSGSGVIWESPQLPKHVQEAIIGLQREILLLRNELNFELWLSRENVQHIGRLHQDRILSKNAEAERQGLVRFQFNMDGHHFILFSSSINCGNTRHKFIVWNEKFTSTRSSRPLPRTSTRTGTTSFRKSFGNSGRRRNGGLLKQQHCGLQRKRRG